MSFASRMRAREDAEDELLWREEQAAKKAAALADHAFEVCDIRWCDKQDCHRRGCELPEDAHPPIGVVVRIADTHPGSEQRLDGPGNERR